MTKQEAIQAMMEGKNVTHRYFSADEWMTMKGPFIYFEDGVKMPADEFWEYRRGDGFEDGFSLFNQGEGDKRSVATDAAQ